LTPFLNRISLGLIKLKEGVDALGSRKLRRILPKDVVVLTQEQIIAHDRDYWISATSTGFSFWDGVAFLSLAW